MVDPMEDIEQTIKFLRSIFSDLPKRLSQNNEDLDICDKETQDLLHVIELTSFDVVRGYKLSKEMNVVRNRRRKIKDEMDLLEPLVTVINKYPNLSNELSRVLGDIRKIKKRNETRTYKMRVREDLKEAIK